mgnify:CR=1 FL=1
MLDDKQLTDLSYEIDEIFYMLARKHKCSSLSLSAIMLARMVRIIEETGNPDDLRSVLELAMTTNDKRRNRRTLQ